MCLFVNGGGYRDRTDDPLLAGQVLVPSELIPQINGAKKWVRTTDRPRMKRMLCQLSYLGIWTVVFIQVVAVSVLFFAKDSE